MPRKQMRPASSFTVVAATCLLAATSWCQAMEIGTGGTEAPTPASTSPAHPSGHGPHGKWHARQPRIQLEHQAQQEVSNDLASITLFAEFRDKDAGAASQRAAVATQSAMARVASDAVVIERRTSLQTYPDYSPEGKPSGWRSRAEIVLEGKEFAALGKSAAKLAPDFAYAGVSYRLSHEARQREEQALMGRAIAAWRDKAQTIAGALGYRNYEPVEVAVRTSSDGGGAPIARMGAPMLMAASADSAPSAALEGGRSRVTVTVSGAVTPR